MSQLTIGTVDVIALTDGTGPFFDTPEAAFPDATPEAWRRAAEIDPGTVGPDGGWLLHFRCFALRLEDGGRILVDAGIGPADSPAAAWAPVPGRLPELLERETIAPEEIDTVVLTHLHTDHVGWAVVADRPYFPNARYVLQRKDFDAVDALNPALRGRLLDPLAATGQLHLTDGEVTLAPGITAVPTPGHTPGHQSVLVSAGGAEVIITGDVLVHPVQLADPTVAYAHEVDQDLARQTRISLLADAKERGARLATAHLSMPFR